METRVNDFIESMNNISVVSPEEAAARSWEAELMMPVSPAKTPEQAMDEFDDMFGIPRNKTRRLFDATFREVAQPSVEQTSSDSWVMQRARALKAGISERFKTRGKGVAGQVVGVFAASKLFRH